MNYGAPPGWYPVPQQPGALRWWDGAVWTAHVASSAPMASLLRLDEEEKLARWARLALACAIPVQLLGWIVARAAIINLVDRLDNLDRLDNGRFNAFGSQSSGFLLFQNVFQLILLGVGIAFLLWFYRAAINSVALGLPARRQASLATASFIIPIVNLWWPYQSVCDVLPAGHPARRRVLRWFLLWIVGGSISFGFVVVSAFEHGAAAIPLFIFPAIQVTLAAGCARDLIQEILAVHQSMAASPPVARS